MCLKLKVLLLDIKEKGLASRIRYYEWFKDFHAQLLTNECFVKWSSSNYLSIYDNSFLKYYTIRMVLSGLCPIF